MRQPEFWNQRDLVSRFMSAILSPLGWLYGASVEWKAAHAQPYRAQAKVVCVGNLTVGGTGKTPIAMAIAEYLSAHGRNVCFLTRGYGGRTKGPMRVSAGASVADVGDEPLQLSQIAPVIVSEDREQGARLAEADGFDTIIMHDGHQNFTLEKDRALVVVDSSIGFGNGLMIPAGPLREPVTHGLQRADAVVVVGGDALALPDLDIPVLQARLITPEQPILQGERVVAFAGIGRPKKFFQSLAGLGAIVLETRSFGDHHRYAPSEIARLKAWAKGLDARLVTTEKDFVRLTAAEQAGITPVPVRAVFDDPDGLGRLLDRI